MIIGFRNQNLFKDNGYTSMIVAVAALTAGAAFMMWLGEQITEKGVGNGISIILLINIVARIPSDLSNLYNTYISGAGNITNAIVAAIIIVGIIVAMFAFIVFLQNSCTVCEEDSGQKGNRGTVHTYSVESKYGRRYPGYLCKFHDVASGCNRKFCRYYAKIRRGCNTYSEVPEGLQPK